jgi:hypothetical protein
MKITGKDLAPYEVIQFDRNTKTQETKVIVKITGKYIQSETDRTVTLELGKIKTEPNNNYYIRKNDYSVNAEGYIVIDYEKQMGRKTNRQSPNQWEFDRQSNKSDICNINKSINSIVWIAVDNYIIREIL